MDLRLRKIEDDLGFGFGKSRTRRGVRRAKSQELRLSGPSEGVSGRPNGNGSEA